MTSSTDTRSRILETIAEHELAGSFREYAGQLARLGPDASILRSGMLFRPEADPESYYGRQWTEGLGRRVGRSEFAVETPWSMFGVVQLKQISSLWDRSRDAHAIVHSIVYADGSFHDEGASPTERGHALNILNLLGRWLPDEAVRLALPAPFGFLAGPGHGAHSTDADRNPRWLAFVHGVAWRGWVPGVRAHRFAWPRTPGGRNHPSGAVPIDDIGPGEKHTAIGPFGSLSTDWASVVDGPIVLASRFVAEWLATGDRLAEIRAVPKDSRPITPTPDAADGEGGEVEETSVSEFALTPKDESVLLAMANYDASRLLSLPNISKETKPGVSGRTTGRCVEKLIRLGLAERPEGDRQGARLTRAGRRLAGEIGG